MLLTRLFQSDFALSNLMSCSYFVTTIFPVPFWKYYSIASQCLQVILHLLLSGEISEYPLVNFDQHHDLSSGPLLYGKKNQLRVDVKLL